MDPISLTASCLLLDRSIIVESQLYYTSTCSVYKGFSRSLNLPIVLKLIKYPVCGNTEIAAREVSNQLTCKHPNIVELYDYFWYYESEDQWVGGLVMEFMTKDLYKDVTDRKTNTYFYREEELVEFIKVMTDTLATAQDLGICHRDIKPQNIFLSQNVYKIGDFGSSKQQTANLDAITLAGTPCYLSPALRLGMLEEKKKIIHNPYKSDVFSLGLTVLQMATLNPPLPLANLEEMCIVQISGLRYSDFIKQMLTWMLCSDETLRPDFVQIHNYFQGDIPQTPQQMECEHLLPSPELQRYKPRCGHSLCYNCSFVSMKTFQNCYSMLCPLCRDVIEWFPEDAQGEVITTADRIYFCCNCKQQEVRKEGRGNHSLCETCIRDLFNNPEGSKDMSILMKNLKYL